MTVFASSVTPLSLTFMVEGTVDMDRNRNAETFCSTTRRETTENMSRMLKKANTKVCSLRRTVSQLLCFGFWREGQKKYRNLEFVIVEPIGAMIDFHRLSTFSVIHPVVVV